MSATRIELVAVADEAGQATYVAERVLATREMGTAPKQQAVLFRASHHSGPLEIELTRRNIPFVNFGWLKFLDAAHVKDVLTVLRFAENPRDRIAGFRVLQLLPGIGPSVAADILDRISGSQGLPSAFDETRVPVRTEADWPLFVALMGRLRASMRGPPIWKMCARGTSRTLRGFTRTPSCVEAICCSWNRSRKAIRRASDFLPN